MNMKTPEEFLASVLEDKRLNRRVFPISFTLTETSDAQLQRAYLDPGWSAITLGPDDVTVILNTILIPQDCDINGHDGFDHLPCLKTIWSLYSWEVIEMISTDNEAMDFRLQGGVT